MRKKILLATFLGIAGIIFYSTGASALELNYEGFNVNIADGGGINTSTESAVANMNANSIYNGVPVINYHPESEVGKAIKSEDPGKLRILNDNTVYEGNPKVRVYSPSPAVK